MCSLGPHQQVYLFGLPAAHHAHCSMAGEPPIGRRDWLVSLGSMTALFFAAPSLAVAKLSSKSVRHAYISSGVVKGSQTTSTMPNGSIDVRYEFTDRGRGPKLHSVITVDRNGFISKLKTAGSNYFNVTVDERFTYRGKSASWKNAVERETSAGPMTRFYASIDGTPEEGAILVRAALAAPDKTVALWPSGNAVVRKATTINVVNGRASRNVTMYELVGLDFSPTPVWLDENGTLFMSGSEWGAVIPTAWAGTLPRLLAAQNDRTATLGRHYATTLPQRSGTAVAFRGIALFDSENATVEPNATVVFHGKTIVAAGDSGVTVPSDARTIDGAGKMLLPGLWNSHLHLAAEFGPRLLAEGVTTIRDPGNSLTYIAATKRQFETGELIGPRVIIAGLMDGSGKYTAPIGTSTDNASTAIEQVHAWKRAGAVQIKIYSSMDPKLVPVIVKEAHALGMRVSGHIPAGMLAQDAVHAGYDEIQHINFLFLNFMPDTKDRTQTPVRLTAAAQRAGTIDLQSPKVKDFIALLKEHEIVSDPTVGFFFNAACLTRPGDIASSGFGEIASWLPAQVRRGLTTTGLPLGPGLEAKYRASAAAYTAMLALLHDNGIRIVAGTDDLLPGFDLVRELELYAQAGIPNANVLQTATIVPARVMRMDDRLGSLRVGKLADAIVVNGDPLAAIRQLRRIETTIKDGVLYDTRALYATAGVTAPANYLEAGRAASPRHCARKRSFV